jgi:hypothetical protein
LKPGKVLVHETGGRGLASESWRRRTLAKLGRHYGKQVLRREQKALARAFPWALGEELSAKTKTLGEEFFTESKQAGSR